MSKCLMMIKKGVPYLADYIHKSRCVSHNLIQGLHANHGAREDGRIRGRMQLGLIILSVYPNGPKCSGYVTSVFFFTIKIQQWASDGSVLNWAVYYLFFYH